LRRFFKSAAFPILLVVILAFIAQRVITNDPGTEAPSYTQIINPTTGLIAKGQSRRGDDQQQGSLARHQGDERRKLLHRLPENTQAELIALLDENDVKTTVHGTGRLELLSLLTYILPFVLFFASGSS
jgi:cell division protease FtsH